MADRIVRAVFYNAVTRSLTGEVKLRIPSTTSGQAHAAVIACTDHAYDNDLTHWAHFDDLICDPPMWRVFKVMGRSRRAILANLPTAEAAEMWLVHNAK